MEQPLVAYTYIKQLWAVGRVADAFDKLCLFVNDPRVAVDATLAAKAWRRLGEWQRALPPAATTAERARHEAAGQLLQSGVEALLARVRPRPRPVVPPRVRLVGRLAL